MTRKDFEIHLALYGADMHLWPEEIRTRALEAYENSLEFRQLVEKERQFEAIWHLRKFEEPSRNLASRIIASAQPRTVRNPQKSLGQFFADLWAGFLTPKLAFVLLLLILVVGFVVGYSDPFAVNNVAEIDLGTFLYEEGGIG